VAAGPTILEPEKSAPQERAFGPPWPALGGGVLLLLSTAFAWIVQPFPPPDALHATDLPALFLVSSHFFGTRIPTVAHVVALTGLAASVLVLLETRWADILRRVVGAVPLAVGVLFVWRFDGAYAGIGNMGSILGFLRAGYYLAVVGAIVLILMPRGRKGTRS
jgi:hypothetical protein